SNAVTDPIGGEVKLRSAWAAGGRLGLLVMPDVLTYANIGATQARMGSFTYQSLGSATTNLVLNAQTYSGWFVGGGVETPLTLIGHNWFMRNEYRYAHYNVEALTPPLTTPGAGTLSVQPSVQTVRTVITYKLGWPR